MYTIDSMFSESGLQFDHFQYSAFQRTYLEISSKGYGKLLKSRVLILYIRIFLQIKEQQVWCKRAQH